MLKTDIWLMGLAALFTASKSENHPLQLDHFIAAVSLRSGSYFETPVFAAASIPHY